jgi:hypothetical protein
VSGVAATLCAGQQARLRVSGRLTTQAGQAGAWRQLQLRLHEVDGALGHVVAHKVGRGARLHLLKPNLHLHRNILPRASFQDFEHEIRGVLQCDQCKHTSMQNKHKCSWHAEVRMPCINQTLSQANLERCTVWILLKWVITSVHIDLPTITKSSGHFAGGSTEGLLVCVCDVLPFGVLTYPVVRATMRVFGPNLLASVRFTVCPQPCHLLLVGLRYIVMLAARNNVGGCHIEGLRGKLRPTGRHHHPASWPSVVCIRDSRLSALDTT